MADAIAYEQLSASGSAPADAEVDLTRLGEIPMELSVEIGRTHMTVGEVLALHIGAIIALDRTAGESADLLVNGTQIARGEVVVVEERFGLRITEITEGSQMGGASEPGAAAAGQAEVAVEATDSQIDNPQLTGAELPQDALSANGEGAAEQAAERIAA